MRGWWCGWWWDRGVLGKWGKEGGLQKGTCLMWRARRTLFVKGLAVIWSVSIVYSIGWEFAHSRSRIRRLVDDLLEEPYLLGFTSAMGSIHVLLNRNVDGRDAMEW